MKISHILAVVLFTASVSARADVNILDRSYGIEAVLPHASSDDIVSFDWDSSGNLYYATSTPDFTFGGLYKVSGGLTTTAVAASSDFSGASVVAIGNNVYFNTSDWTQQKIYKYGPLDGSATFSLASTTANYGIFGSPAYQGQLFITGAADWGTSHIYYSTLDSSGSLVSDPARDLGVTAGGSGPLTFDAAGNLYYAPGYGDLSIYRWSAAQVASAIADPLANPLSVANQLWLDYSPLFSTVSGATSMLVDSQGNLLLTLTSFSDPSELVKLGVNETGSYDGSATAILETMDRLGELRSEDGNVYVSDGDQIYNVVPEPSSVLLLGFGLVLFAWVNLRHRLRKQGLPVAVIAVALALTSSAWAGPYSPGSDQPGGTGIAASDPAIVGWATQVVDITRGPVDITLPDGAKATFGDPSNALGAADASASNPYSIVSLGDGGSITLSLSVAICNLPGPDLAVFENSFKVTNVSYFLELAFVDVSSNGTDFFRFPSVSLTGTTTQIAGFGYLDPTNIYDLAGKDLAGYGTPFDLQELAGVSALLDINAIKYVRITDVVGSINPTYATHDSLGNIINDPWKTNFNTGGFDLDAVAAIHIVPEPNAAWFLLFGAPVLAWIRNQQTQPVHKA